MKVLLLVLCSTFLFGCSNILGEVRDFYKGKAEAMYPPKSTVPSLTSEQFDYFIEMLNSNPYIPESVKPQAAFAVFRDDWDQYYHILYYYLGITGREEENSPKPYKLLAKEHYRIFLFILQEDTNIPESVKPHAEFSASRGDWGQYNRIVNRYLPHRPLASTKPTQLEKCTEYFYKLQFSSSDQISYLSKYEIANKLVRNGQCMEEGKED